MKTENNELNRLAQEIYEHYKFTFDKCGISISDMLERIESYLNGEPDFDHLNKVNVWFIQSLTLCKFFEIDYNDNFDLSNFKNDRQLLNGSLVEINPSNSDKYWKDVTKIEYSNLHAAILFHMFACENGSEKYSISSSPTYQLFDFARLFNIMYGERVIHGNHSIYLKTWLNLAYGINSGYDIYKPFLYDLSYRWNKKIRAFQQSIYDGLGTDVIYFDCDTAWIKGEIPEAFYNIPENVHQFNAEKINHFVILGKKKYIESNDINFKIRGIR